jgi:hypothetical protein
MSGNCLKLKAPGYVPAMLIRCTFLSNAAYAQAPWNFNFAIRKEPLAMFLKRTKILFAFFFLLNAIPVPQLQAAAITFSGPELLGKPTDASITINVVPDANVSMYFEYGTASGVYTAQTPTTSATASESHEVVISGLQSNTRYYYRMQYAEPSDPGNWIARDEHSF